MAREQEPYKIKWTATARIQYFDILEYWDNRNKSNRYSLALMTSIWEKVELIANEPFVAKSFLHKDIRSYPMKHYSIIYRINEQTIDILALWDNRQNPKKLLAQIKSQMPDVRE